MRRLLGVLLVATGGCSGFASPTPDDFRRLRLDPAPPHPEAVRIRFHLSVDSAWLAGEFDGVLLAREGASPLARVQLFGDVGPKVLDLLARPDRILGYFPQTHEGVDCRLPGEAAPHPILFLGASLLENLADVTEARVAGIRPDPEGWWLDLRPVVPGLRSQALRTPDGRTTRRRFRWMYGLGWSELWERPDEGSVSAPGFSLRVRVLGTEPLERRPDRAFDLDVPGDVKLVEGSRK